MPQQRCQGLPSATKHLLIGLSWPGPVTCNVRPGQPPPPCPRRLKRHLKSGVKSDENPPDHFCRPHSSSTTPAVAPIPRPAHPPYLSRPIPPPPNHHPTTMSTPPKSGPWLHAWHDPVSNIHAHSSCVRLVDLNGDNSHVLLVADASKKMKVYKGTSIVSEHQLLEMPVSMSVFYTSREGAGGGGRTPAIGIAGGAYVFIYRHLRPYFKFTLPNVLIDPQVC